MPAKSEAQRRLFGMVLAQKRGELKDPSPKIKKVATQVSESSAEDFARKKRREGVVKMLASPKYNSKSPVASGVVRG
jgi:hypothetical protein